jgi:hypothetical protein
MSILWYCGHNQGSEASPEVPDDSFEDWQMPRLDHPSLKEIIWSMTLSIWMGESCATTFIEANRKMMVEKVCVGLEN